MPGQHQALPGSAVTPQKGPVNAQPALKISWTRDPNTPEAPRQSPLVSPTTAHSTNFPHCTKPTVFILKMPPHLCLSPPSKSTLCLFCWGFLVFCCVFFLTTNLIQVSFCQAWLSFHHKQHKNNLFFSFQPEQGQGRPRALSRPSFKHSKTKVIAVTFVTDPHQRP